MWLRLSLPWQTLSAASDQEAFLTSHVADGGLHFSQLHAFISQPT